MKLESVLGKIKKSPHPAKLESCSKSFFPTSFESFQRGTLQHGRSMMEISNFEIFPNSNSPIFPTKLSNFTKALIVSTCNILLSPTVKKCFVVGIIKG